MGLPAYPSFRPLLREDKEAFDQAFRRDIPSASELTFTNLYCWRQAYAFEVSTFRGHILVRSQGRFFEPVCAAPSACSKRPVIEQVLGDSGTAFVRCPEATQRLFEGDSRFRVSEDPDNADYVYAAQDLITLAGRKYDGKRNLIRRFKKSFAFEYTAFDAGNIRKCLDFEDSWCAVKDCDSIKGLADERQAIREMIGNFAGFGLSGGCIRVGERIVAMALAEPLNAGTLVMHALKADPSMTGLYQTMLNEFLVRHGGAFRYVNLEQDLGVAGLRTAKLSYHPAMMVRKYSIQIR